MLVLETAVKMNQEWRVDCSKDVPLFMDDELHTILNGLVLADTFECEILPPLRILH